MLRKTLLAGIALINLNVIEASQNIPPLHTPQPGHHPQNPAQHDKTQHEPAHHTNDAKHCPPCPYGGVGGWVLIPAGPGTPCNQNAAEEEARPHHKPAGEHHPVAPHKPSLHPLPTPEEEALAAQLKPIQAHIFKRSDPNHPNAEKRGEWGKALNGKVYFKTLGIWKHDPSVHATTDIIATGVKDKIKMFNQMGQQQQPQKPTPKPARKPVQAAEAPADKPDGPTTAAPTNVPPPPPAPQVAPAGGKQPAKRWPKVNVPDALGTTQGRVQSATTNPTKGNELEFGLGAPNRAQTGVTGTPIPEADTSGSKPAVPPPSAKLDQ